jgi:ATP-dependent Clp protease ATP-binding subunit ClpA
MTTTQPAATFTAPDKLKRCSWCASDPIYIAYHDNEWGRPVHDDNKLFEKICLEGFQAGLSWLTILRKRENFRTAFKGFDPQVVAKFTSRDVERLMKNEGIVRNRMKIEATIATMARIPSKTVSKDDTEVLAHLDETLKRVVYGQDKALQALTSAIKLARAGLRDPEKPIGCYLFSGPTGVGKTEAARQLSISLGIELIRFDMSEYMERHTVSRLLGAPPGYVGFDQGGLLTDAIDQHPHCVLLLDEIEKAHQDLYNILLQVMDHGKLTDHNGKTIDFRNVILIMTTNAGAADLARAPIGFTRKRKDNDDNEAINRLFTPEFRNRLDAIVPFSHLPATVIQRVVDKFIMQLEAQLADRNITIELSDEARNWLVEHGYDEAMGARPMSRIIHQHIKTQLADEILFGRLKNGGAVRVVILSKESGAKSLGFIYPEGPVLPRPERDIVEAGKKRTNSSKTKSQSDKEAATPET